MYQKQLRRVERWFDRLASINQGRTHDRSTDYYSDEVYAFFLNCYHLKDWIINDGSVNLSNKKKLVEDLVTNDKHLSVCADICNSLKHLKLNSPPRSGAQPQFAQTHYALNLGGPETTISVKYTVDTAYGSVDAFDLGTECLNAWRQFINKYKL